MTELTPLQLGMSRRRRSAGVEEGLPPFQTAKVPTSQQRLGALAPVLEGPAQLPLDEAMAKAEKERKHEEEARFGEAEKYLNAHEESDEEDCDNEYAHVVDSAPTMVQETDKLDDDLPPLVPLDEDEGPKKHLHPCQHVASQAATILRGVLMPSVGRRRSADCGFFCRRFDLHFGVSTGRGEHFGVFSGCGRRAGWT